MSVARYLRKVQKGNRVITENFCCYCVSDAQKELKIDYKKFHKLFKINEDTGYYVNKNRP